MKKKKIIKQRSKTAHCIGLSAKTKLPKIKKEENEYSSWVSIHQTNENS